MAVKILKAFGIIVYVVLVLLMILYLLVFAYTNYSFRTSHWTTGPDEAGFWYYYWDGLHKSASVVRCDIDPSLGHAEITIPESVTSIGLWAIGYREDHFHPWLDPIPFGHPVIIYGKKAVKLNDMPKTIAGASMNK